MRASRSVVYFGYLGEEGTDGDIVRRRLGFMERQLRWLYDLLPLSPVPFDLTVAYVAPRAWDEDVHGLVGHLGFHVDPLSVASDRRNSFEYPGFRALKALALRSDPDHLIYYCHSKGIVQLAAGKMGLFRLHAEVGLTADLGRLIADHSLTRAGLFPYRFGWCWYNFFWIKAGYMAGLPIAESADRYYFEALIGQRGDKEGYRGVLPLIDLLPFGVTGIPLQPWYRAEETSTPALVEAYDRYAEMASPRE